MQVLQLSSTNQKLDALNGSTADLIEAYGRYHFGQYYVTSAGTHIIKDSLLTVKTTHSEYQFEILEPEGTIPSALSLDCNPALML
jgi:hypothetical protein